MLNKTIKNIAWLSGDQVLRLATGFLVGAWIARYLQPQQYGLLNYTLAFIGLFLPFALLNELNQVAIRDLTVESDRKDEILGSVFIIRIFGALLTVFLSLASIFLLQPDEHTTQLLVLILSISTLTYPLTAIDCWFSYKVQAKSTVISRNIIFVIVTLVRVALVYFHAPLIAFAGALSLEAVLGSVALMIAYRFDGQWIKNWKFSSNRAKQMLKDSWALILSGFAVSIYVKIDQTMLGQMIGNHSVGIYAVAVRLSDICCFLPVAIVASVTPSITTAFKRDEDEFYEKLQKLFDLMTLLSISLAIFMTFVSKPLIHIVYGESYSEASNIVILHIWSVLFVFLGFAKNIWVVNTNQGAYSMISRFFGALINILLNLFLIPRYDAMGAAIATLISYGFTDWLTCFIYPPARRVGWMMNKSVLYNSLVIKLFKG